VTQYVPVLRTKLAEWMALRLLPEDVRRAVTPCLELLPQELALSHGEAHNHLPHAVRRFAKKIRRSWGRRPIFVDASHINPSVRPATAALLAEVAPAYGISPIWILRLHEDVSSQLVAGRAAEGGTLRLALRVNYDELDKDDATDRIDVVLRTLGVSLADTDLLVEYGVVDATPPDYEWLEEHAPYFHDWREFVVVGGSFLPDLSGLAVGTRFHPRWDWLHWEAWARVTRHREVRLPVFSDYTIHHAIFREPVEGANPSASIRYTAEDYWVILRGEAVYNRRMKESRYNTSVTLNS